jgi:membrane protease YdiL (CAAX protease family)
MTEAPITPPTDTAQSDRTFLERHNINPVVFAVFVLGVVFVLYQLVGGTITVLLLGGATITRDNVFSMRLFTMLGQVLFILLPTLFFARLLSLRPADVFQWRLPSVRETVYASLGLLWLQQIFQIYLFFQERIPVPDSVRQLLDPIKQMIEEMFKGLVRAESLPELAFVLLVVAFIPAIVEELLFRGVVQHSLSKVLTPMRAAAATGVIFGLFHFNPFAVLPLIGLGCYFGFLRARSESIIIAMTAHFLNNTIAVIVTYFGMTEETIVGMGGELEPATPMVLLQLLLFVMLFGLSMVGYLRASEVWREEEGGEP